MRAVSSVLGCLMLAACGGTARRAPAPSPTAARPTPVPTAQVAAPPEAPPPTPDDDPDAEALARAFLARLTVWRRADGTRVLSRRCREGPVDCEARLTTFARLIARAARAHDLDPFLLGALAMRESGLDPAALGRRNEAGIVQLHPRGAGRDVRYVQDRAYRDACQAEVDACQAPVLERGAASLAASIEECGSLVAGLGAYATGHCTERAVHPQRVLEEQRTLRDLAEAP
ncbi:MAG: transglycosylase SLT domain-containing protein [Myxococcales bacterium]|nr:transglycosylase SLT domain-containing protein [Myxococcales bacterium]